MDQNVRQELQALDLSGRIGVLLFWLGLWLRRRYLEAPWPVLFGFNQAILVAVGLIAEGVGEHIEQVLVIWTSAFAGAWIIEAARRVVPR